MSPAEKSPSAIGDGSIWLGDVAAVLPVLVVSCRKCERRGKLSTAKLLRQHGPDFAMTDLRRILAGDCPRLLAALMRDPCDASFPDLPKWFGSSSRPDARDCDTVKDAAGRTATRKGPRE